MKAPYIRLALVGAVILITQAVPDVPATALAQVRVPRVPIPIEPVPVRPLPRGGGCGGGVPVAKVPVKPAVPVEVPVPKMSVRPATREVRPAFPEMRPTMPEVRPPVLPHEPAQVGGAFHAPERLEVLEQIRVSGVKRDWARVDELAGQELRRPGGEPTLNEDLKAVQTAARTSLAVERVLPVVASAKPDVPALDRRLDDLLAATGDKDLVHDVKEFCGVEALRHGNAEEAKTLLPAGWEKEDPRALLRDMKIRIEAKYPVAPDGGATPPKVGPVP